VRVAALVPLCISALMLAPALSSAAEFDLPQGTGRELIYGNCQTCHDLQSLVDSAGIPRRAWNAVLDDMTNFGLRVTDEQRAAILDYLGTYLGPNPPPPEEAPVVAAVDASQIYANTCAGCHQPDGAGRPSLFPPLAGNSDLFLAQDLPVLVVLNGLTGPIEVNGEAFDNTMPSFGFLSDEDIAAVVNFIRSSWGNDALVTADIVPVTADDVATARASATDTAEAVHAYRETLP
jgi:mono/diheme cytochrome c family protein